MSWSVENIQDLTGKTIIITGANTGLGLEATKILASKNATIVMACRSIDRANEAKNKVLIEYKDAKLDIIQLDLSDLESITKFTNEFKKKYKTLDVLLNNAGIMTTPYGKTKDGFELQNGVNHLGHFALTAQLFETLKKTKDARIVNVASIAHKFGKMDFDNYLYENGKYNKERSYARSKLSNLLFTYELDRKVKEYNLDIKVIAAHPGVSSTELGRHLRKSKVANFFASLFTKFGQPASVGTLPEVRASVDPDAKGGEYYGPNGFYEMKGKPVLVKSTKRSHNLDDAKKLWELSEKLTNQKFNF